MCEECKSIGVFIDGGYFAKVNEALEEQLPMNSLFSIYPRRNGSSACFARRRMLYYRKPLFQGTLSGK